MPPSSMLNSTVAGLTSPGPIMVDIIYKRARFTSVLVSNLFLINLMYPSAWPLLWWLYDGDMDHLCSAFSRTLRVYLK